MQLSGVRDGQRTGHGGGHGRREVRWLPSHPAVGTSRVAVPRPCPAASVAHCCRCWSCYWCFGRLFDVVSDSGTDEEKERDIDSYGVMLLVVMSASADCQVGMVHQSLLDRVATAPSLLFPPLVPSSSIPSSRLSPPLLHSCSPSRPLSPLVLSPALLVSLYTVFIIAVRGLWLKICPLPQNPHFHEEVQRVVGVDNQVHGRHAGDWHDVSNIAAGSTPPGS